jgi:hypothetical protein
MKGGRMIAEAVPAYRAWRFPFGRARSDGNHDK